MDASDRPDGFQPGRHRFLQVPEQGLSALCVVTVHAPHMLALQPYFSPEELTDLTLLIVAINGWNRFAIAFRKLPI
jgi:alkylhydroperoxidase family enzyme